MVQINKYYKSRAVGVTFEVGLTINRDLAEPSCLRNMRFLYVHDTGSHYTTNINSDFSLNLRAVEDQRNVTGMKQIYNDVNPNE